MRTIRPFCKCEGVLISPPFTPLDAAEDCPLTWSLATTYKMGHSPIPALSRPRVPLRNSGWYNGMQGTSIKSGGKRSTPHLDLFSSWKLTVVQKHAARVYDVHRNNQRE